MKREFQNIALPFLSLCILVLLTPSVVFGLVLHTDDEPTDKPPDDVVGRWRTNSSCVVINPNYVITTRHQGGSSGTVQIGGIDYTIAQITNIGSVDLRVVRITTADGQPANLPNWVPLYTKRIEKNETELTMGGFGKGRGETLYTDDMAYGYAWASGGNTTQRWGANRINNYTNNSHLGGYTSDVVWGKFNDVGHGNYMQYEAAPASWDSGGGWFIKDAGVWKVAGLFRGVEHSGETWFRRKSDPNFFHPDYFDAVRVSSYDEDVTEVITPYLICGHVSDSNNPLKDVLLSCDDDIMGSDITDLNGYYEFSVYYGWSGMITPSKDYYMFSPNSISYSNVTENLTDEDYVVSALTSDNFNDNRRGSMWRIFEDDHSLVWVNEVNQRLEIRAVSEANGHEAIYASNEWKLDSVEDFSLKVNFHHKVAGKRRRHVLKKLVSNYGSYNRISLDANCNTKQLCQKCVKCITEQDSWLFIRLTPDCSDDNYISFEAGRDATGRYWQYEEVVDGNVASAEQTFRDSDDGTLYVSYDAIADELYLSYTEYGSEDAWQTISGLLQNEWAGEPIYVYIGGGSDNVAINSGEAYLANFAVNTGVLLDWPPKTDINGDGYIDWLDIDVLCEQWLETGEDLDADINGDNTVDFKDFAEFAEVW